MIRSVQLASHGGNEIWAIFYACVTLEAHLTLFRLNPPQARAKLPAAIKQISPSEVLTRRTMQSSVQLEPSLSMRDTVDYRKGVNTSQSVARKVVSFPPRGDL